MPATAPFWYIRIGCWPFWIVSSLMTTSRIACPDRRDLVHDVEHRLLEDGAQAARAATCASGASAAIADMRALGEPQLDAVHLEQLLVLLDERVLAAWSGCRSAPPRRARAAARSPAGGRRTRGSCRTSADPRAAPRAAAPTRGAPSSTVILAPKPICFCPTRCSMMSSRPDERAAADEQDVGGVDLQELLLRVLAAALGRHVADRALDDLEQRLLHALAGDVARDRRVVALARDLVDLVDVDDAALRLLDVVVGVLQQVDDDVLDVLADVARLGQVGGVRDRERDVQDARQRLREQRLAAARRAEQQDVRLLSSTSSAPTLASMRL